MAMASHEMRIGILVQIGVGVGLGARVGVGVAQVKVYVIGLRPQHLLEELDPWTTWLVLDVGLVDEPLDVYHSLDHPLESQDTLPIVPPKLGADTTDTPSHSWAKGCSSKRGSAATSAQFMMRRGPKGRMH